MDKQKILFLIFLLVAAIQIYVPAKMIFEKENILAEGIAYKFKTAPVDPSDPFRGKYIVLRFEENSYSAPITANFEKGQTVFLSLYNDADGFAKIKSAHAQKPSNPDFVKAIVAREYKSESFQKLRIQWPFDRYYMEESKAYEAELIYRQMQRDGNATGYALVNVIDGEAVLQDVLINEVSIRELVDASLDEK